jgi:hypothetical protein
MKNLNVDAFLAEITTSLKKYFTEFKIDKIISDIGVVCTAIKGSGGHHG